MIPEKYKDLFNRMRNMKLNEVGIMNPAEPGLFRENTSILFVGVNPGIPKPDKVEADKFLLDPTISDDEFHKYYEQAQKSWYFYNFIINFCKWENASILNIVHFPTQFNYQPTLRSIEKCEKYLKEAINLINPKFIITVGNLPYERLKNMDLKYKIIKSIHYSYLMRKGEKVYKKEVNKIREELCSNHNYF